ncbi:hypothetical protein HOY34_11195 [Xinfangfangia sp. D13-10-4-6]|uniref:hypothetical protein n=1 Tax=Pseudogemmobacter hezensis TaxID=2737662 RepID=UPI0015535657|nr:hypothetical protein [Pseudogemmobacter hezensis]NPD15768.1 hypothetical protein [Pseudogemmobacter hezensis]
MTEPFDIYAFEERAAIMEFNGGLSRFEAETRAARAQGRSRWQAMLEVRNADRNGNSQGAQDHGSPMVGHHADHLSAVQPDPTEQDGSLPQRDVQT